MCCSTRHGSADHVDGAETYPYDMTRYCKCLGLNGGHTDNPADLGECCGAASGDDGLCDRCRTTCNQVETPEPSAVAPGPGNESAFPQSVVLTGI